MNKPVSSGIDIIEVKRIDQAIKRWGDQFLTHVFCDEEIAYAKRQKFPSQHFAARFAAKEAILKAVGDNGHLSWKDMKIIHDKNGKPHCMISDKRFHNRILISMSHTRNYAIANAIITS
jgi:holo-[acyl-carrier-protein] synthase